MTTLIFWYSQDQGCDHEAATPEEIDAALDTVNNLADAYGTVATVVRGNLDNPALYVGMNGGVGALYYTNASEAYWSKGDGPVDGEPLLYDWQHHEFPMPPNAEIPAADVRAAVKQFAHSGTRPTGVEWQEWSPPRNPDSGATLAHDDPAWG